MYRCALADAPSRLASAEAGDSPRLCSQGITSGSSSALADKTGLAPADVAAAFTIKYLWAAALLAVATVLLWLVVGVFPISRAATAAGTAAAFVQALVLLTILTMLTYSATAYLVARYGAARRLRSFVPVPRDQIAARLMRSQPSLTVLVPAYQEEPQVIWRTVMSAALQQYPGVRIVVLLDDPPDCTDAQDRRRRGETHAAITWVDEALRVVHRRVHACQSDLLRRVSDDWRIPFATVAKAASDLTETAEVLRDWAASVRPTGHEARFLADEVLSGLAAEIEAEGSRLLATTRQGRMPTIPEVLTAYARLLWVFDADVSVFERRRYTSLSHEPNKAMNLNAYLGLMGASVVEVCDELGRRLIRSTGAHAQEIPFPDYVLTLDADSVLLPDYCVRLVEAMERPENSDVAVIQTPYCAFPGASSSLERIAAAQTDLLHIVHQGKTHFGATFWVGANAIIRRVALEDIAETEVVEGVTVTRYIQDRTVIEDTESTVDLLAQGWRLYNYPARLAFSATPPDFGSLVIQRRRWANGGLLILPKLLRLAGRGPLSAKRALGCALQVNYLGSIAWTNLGLLILLLFPHRMLPPGGLLLASTYFVAQAWDLKASGYSVVDVIRIYALNLLLLPVNLAGVATSVVQAATSRKIPFARTPKVADRVRAPAVYVFAPVVILAVSAAAMAVALQEARPATVVFGGMNALLAVYALVAFVSIRGGVSDLLAPLVARVAIGRERSGG